ncbi:MAG: PD40 domain-containing protein [Acidobacteria bacterium]|nr:PD40 domain-containing protein [Acidobacteriota bacterium]
MALFLLWTLIYLGDEAQKEEWKVDEPPYPMTDISIDVTEGTWMNLDVSPDGQTIVFDLLGDIYEIPISGGEANALTHSVAWDMQPTYSPDGKTIAYTSDAGGGDNIWIMNREGQDAKAISKETFRLLNSPAWSADGSYLAARKHFTSSRSIGSGEIWLYHLSGGSGVQLTEKPNDQKDVGEPAFSPDGRYLYTSFDATPGKTFEYNKDPNSGIYAIRRLDLTTGKAEVILSGSGGAVRPTPSPDGRYLAFIRRLDYETALFLYDRQSGETWPVFNKLDRDMQETWAIHGVYPRFDWTPDSKSLIFWAAGKLNRLDIAGKKYVPIPFHIKTTKKVAQALRFPVEVSPDQFPVRMMRWTDVSPQGQQVVFQALGHIYIADLPVGTPRRLTEQTDHFEMTPRFSHDGKSVVYTTWDDQELGSVRIVSTRGGKTGKVVSTAPGHYMHPSFSPDDKEVAVMKLSGGYLRSPLHSLDTGIYLINLRQKTMERITESGADPHFDETGLYFTERSGDSTVLVHLKWDDRTRRDVAKSELASQIRVSPNGKWIAFQEDYNVFVCPNPDTGKPIDLGHEMKNLPVKKLSTHAGYNLSWTGDSHQLSWSLGPKLTSVAISEEIFDKDVDATDIEINMTHTTAKPSGITALVGVRAITMKGDEVIENAVVVVTDNRITAVGPADQMVIPTGAYVMNLSGYTLMPGLIDVHAHGAQATNEIIPEQNWLHYASLSFGVTTVHDPSNDTESIFAASELGKAGMIVAPRIFSTGTILYGAKLPDHTATVESVDDARGHLERLKAVGAFSVKSYNQPRRNQRQQVLAAARELEMMVVPEGGSLLQHNLTMVVDGHTGVEHAIPIARAYADITQLWSQTEVQYTPTLIVGYGGVWGENYWYQKTEVWKHERLARFVPPFILEPRSKRREMVPDNEFNHFRNAEVCKQLADAGVRVNLGAHGQREGLGAHWEMWMLAQGGMKNLDVLACGTINGARYLGLDKDLGSIEVGKLADLVILAQNPLDDIRHTDSVHVVMVNGVMYDAETMHEVRENGRNRLPFFWKRSEGTHISFPALSHSSGQQGCVCGH